MYDMIYPHIKMPDTTIASSPALTYILSPYSLKTAGEWYKEYYTCYQKECVPGKWNPALHEQTAPPPPDVIHVSVCKFLAEESKRRILTTRYPDFQFHWDARTQCTIPPPSPPSPPPSKD